MYLNDRCESYCSRCSPSVLRPPTPEPSPPAHCAALPGISLGSPSTLLKTTNHASARLPDGSALQMSRTRSASHQRHLFSWRPRRLHLLFCSPPTSRAALSTPKRRYTPEPFRPARPVQQPLVLLSWFHQPYTPAGLIPPPKSLAET